MQVKFSDGSVAVCGYVPRDAEYKTVGDKNSSLTKFSVKVGERPSPDINQHGEAIWCNCECWHNAARAAMHLKKGDTVLCIGKIEIKGYTDKNGEAKTSKKLVCEFVIPMAVAPAAPQPAKNAILPDDLSEFEEILSDSDVPF